MRSPQLTDNAAAGRRVKDKLPRSHILINHELADWVTDDLFDKHKQLALASDSDSGRGAVTRFNHHGQRLILKSYFRGGLPGRFIRDSYFFTGVNKTRMWREFRLLQEMGKMGLPVPRPFAARCRMASPFTYRGELIMQQIEDSRALSELLEEETPDHATWEKIGRVIARFHDKLVYHSDLNASNILLTSDGEVFLVDFDKCYFKTQGPARGNRWALGNLKRLQQSLHKIAGRAGNTGFNQDHWQALRHGYDYGN